LNKPSKPPRLEIRRRGLMLVLSSPSGAGKSTISRRLLERHRRLIISTSATTRPARPGEVPGKDYIFVEPDEFDQMVADGQFLEHAHVFGNLYGTPREPVLEALDNELDVLFDVDWQGTQQLKQNARADVVTVFVLPPSFAELERRLQGRGQDSEGVIRLRMARAADEMSHWPEYDYIIVNQDLDESVNRVSAILVAERLRRERLIGLPKFVAKISQP